MNNFQKTEMQIFDEEFRDKLILVFKEYNYAEGYEKPLAEAKEEVNEIKSWLLAHDARLLDMVIGLLKGRQILPAYMNMLTDEYMRKNTIKTPEQAIDFLTKDFNENISSLITELEGWKK